MYNMTIQCVLDGVSDHDPSLRIKELAMDEITSSNNDPIIEAQSLFDLIFPKESRLQAGLSDAEASFLYGLWKNAPVGASSFPIPETSDKKQVVPENKRLSSALVMT